MPFLNSSQTNRTIDSQLSEILFIFQNCDNSLTAVIMNNCEVEVMIFPDLPEQSFRQVNGFLRNY